MSAAAFMVGQSDWLPMMMPMVGLLDLLRIAMEVRWSAKRRTIGRKTPKESGF